MTIASQLAKHRRQDRQHRNGMLQDFDEKLDYLENVEIPCPQCGNEVKNHEWEVTGAGDSVTVRAHCPVCQTDVEQVVTGCNPFR